jgi:hypothetical protein
VVARDGELVSVAMATTSALFRDGLRYGWWLEEALLLIVALKRKEVKSLGCRHGVSGQEQRHAASYERWVAREDSNGEAAQW